MPEKSVQLSDSKAKSDRLLAAHTLNLMVA